MKTGKSADSNGICAEHFKYGVDEIVPVIVNIINKIFKDLDIPEKLKIVSSSFYQLVKKLGVIL
jgi:hypothetical protein